MGFGVSLALMGMGAVLALAVKWEVPGIDLQMIGWILLAIGAGSMTLTTLFTRRTRFDDGVETIEPDLMFIRNDPRQVRVPPRAHRENG